MSEKWIDDQTTLSLVSPEILRQESDIAAQRALVEQMNASGAPDAVTASQFLDDMCGALMRMRREARQTKIALRESSFGRPSEASNGRTGRRV